LYTRPDRASSTPVTGSGTGVGAAVCALARLYPLGYDVVMVEIRQTEVYATWFARLRDR
jgi:hypothetical protein